MILLPLSLPVHAIPTTTTASACNTNNYYCQCMQYQQLLLPVDLEAVPSGHLVVNLTSSLGDDSRPANHNGIIMAAMLSFIESFILAFCQIKWFVGVYCYKVCCLHEAPRLSHFPSLEICSAAGENPESVGDDNFAQITFNRSMD